MTTKELREKASEILIQTLQTLGASELIPNVTVEWNPDFTRRMGDACFNQRTGKGVIRFSIPLWPHATEEQRRETVIHEVCHIVDYWLMTKVPGYPRDGGHGIPWKRLMHKCGLAGDRCHTVKRPDALKRAKNTVYCACKAHLVTDIIINRINQGRRYLCKFCKQAITTSPRTTEVQKTETKTVMVSNGVPVVLRKRFGR